MSLKTQNSKLAAGVISNFALMQRFFFTPCFLFKQSLFIAFATIVLARVLVLQPFTARAEEEVWDPIEETNRSLFDFNNFFDRNLLEPVSKGYKSVTPEFARTGVGNFFRNLGYPSYLVSDVVQTKFEQAGIHTGRFLINSTLGIFGLIDVAKYMGIEHHEEDFGIALAYQGVPPGPYIMLPFLGPSNLRDFTGRLVDLVLDPFYWIAYSNASNSTKLWVPAGATVLRAVHQRSNLADAVDAAKESSLDYYLFVQSAYYQYREGLLNDGKDPGDE